MLHILRVDVESHRVVLILQGQIVDQWANALQRECLELSRAGLRVSLDLTGVVFISRTGFEVLGRLFRNGVEIVACSPLIADMLEQEGVHVGCSESVDQ